MMMAGRADRLDGQVLSNGIIKIRTNCPGFMW